METKNLVSRRKAFMFNFVFMKKWKWWVEIRKYYEREKLKTIQSKLEATKKTKIKKWISVPTTTCQIWYSSPQKFLPTSRLHTNFMQSSSQWRWKKKKKKSAHSNYLNHWFNIQFLTVLQLNIFLKFKPKVSASIRLNAWL